MHKYRSLVAWQRAHRLAVLAHRFTDAAHHPRSRALFDQMRRAAVSVEANVVEGYGLSTGPLFRRHLRVALGSAAEAECLVRLAEELEYLPAERAGELLALADGSIAALQGLLRVPLATKC
ncbi:MAG: four helix bundle protein [Gemmatimonadales bacterium]|nr:four helix bundle protein [Gemmatimonadales bacterium]